MKQVRNAVLRCLDEYENQDLLLPAASCGVSKRNCAVANTACAQLSFGAISLTIHPCSKLQGILAKANKETN